MFLIHFLAYAVINLKTEDLRMVVFYAAQVLFFLGDGLSDLAELMTELQERGIAVIAVKGNCDFRSAVLGNNIKKTEIIELLGKTILVTHGDLCEVKYGTAQIEKLAEDIGADVVLFGHTHEKLERYVDVTEKYKDIEGYHEKLCQMKNYYLFNPGSASQYGSYGVLTLGEDYCLFSHGD